MNFLSLLILARTSMLFICQMLFYAWFGWKLKFTNNHVRRNHEGCPNRLTLVCLENHTSRPLISATAYIVMVFRYTFLICDINIRLSRSHNRHSNNTQKSAIKINDKHTKAGVFLYTAPQQIWVLQNKGLVTVAHSVNILIISTSGAAVKW